MREEVRDVDALRDERKEERELRSAGMAASSGSS
jgi:hypothetical protein